ncbi:MAG: TolC family protein, partial [Gemmataceae bacterium]|nr:TolC family protein [Gemmataceae bacterium]
FMGKKYLPVAAWFTLIGLAGCATDSPERYGHRPFDVPQPPGRVKVGASPTAANPASGVVPAAYTSGDPPADKVGGKFDMDGGKLPSPKSVTGDKSGPKPATAVQPELSLADLINMTVERNPRLAQVGWAVETARGRAIQAGLYPNPTLSVTGDELGDRTGPGGIWTAPYFSQEIVTGNKLALSKAAALKEVDQAALRVVAERYRLFTDVRQNYYEVVTLQRRADILGQLVGLADKSVENANKLLKAKEGSELDVVQLEVDLERYKADLEATKKALPAAFRRLAASVGVEDLPYTKVGGDLESPLPEYELERVRTYILGIHPDLRSAQIGVERAQLVVKRATVEPIPNVTLGTGYVRQNQNKSDDWVIAASIPVPLWNRNQGNILAAKAQVGEALNEVGRVQNDLVGRLAAAYTTFAAASQRAGKYKTAILPKAEQSYKLALMGQKGGEFEYLRVLQAQRAVAEARLEYLRSLGEAWRAASEIAGFMLEDQWPPAPSAPFPPKNP